MARVLVVQHSAMEGLGWLFEWLPAAGLDVHPIHPYLGHRVPTVVEGDALIVLGGAMGANDDEVAPWLPAARSLLQSAVEDGVPTLGICLGAQLLAVACGGVVQPGAAGPELGLGTVAVSVSPSDADPLLSTGELPVVHWHFDAVSSLPPQAVLLAGSQLYPHQAFRVGDVAWGLQFHAEATPDMVRQWATADADALGRLGRSPLDVVDEVRTAEAELRASGEALARRFAAIVTG